MNRLSKEASDPIAYAAFRQALKRNPERDLVKAILTEQWPDEPRGKGVVVARDIALTCEVGGDAMVAAFVGLVTNRGRSPGTARRKRPSCFRSRDLADRGFRKPPIQRP